MKLVSRDACIRNSIEPATARPSEYNDPGLMSTPLLRRSLFWAVPPTSWNAGRPGGMEERPAASRRWGGPPETPGPAPRWSGVGFDRCPVPVYLDVERP